MIDGAGRNHFVTLMIFMNYSCILEKRYLTYKSTYFRGGGGGGEYCNICYIGTCICHCQGYGFQAAYSRIGYINQRVWVPTLRLKLGIIFQDTDNCLKILD